MRVCAPLDLYQIIFHLPPCNPLCLNLLLKEKLWFGHGVPRAQSGRPKHVKHAALVTSPSILYDQTTVPEERDRKKKRKKIGAKEKNRMANECDVSAAGGPFGGPPRQAHPPWDEVRSWASENHLDQLEQLDRFVMTFASKVAAADRDGESSACARALFEALAVGAGVGIPESPEYSAGWLIVAAGTVGAFLRIVGSAGLLAGAEGLFLPPRQSSRGPAPIGAWSQPLTDPLYRYPDGTLTPYWPFTPATLRAYARQTLLDNLRYEPDPDTYAAVGRLWHQRELPLPRDIADTLSQAYRQAKTLVGMPRVSPYPVLSGPRAFGAVRDPDIVVAPFLIVIDVVRGGARALISHADTVLADYPEGVTGLIPPDRDGVTMRLADAGGPRYDTPQKAWRTLLGDLVAAVESGCTRDVGLYSVSDDMVKGDTPAIRKRVIDLGLQVDTGDAISLDPSCPRYRCAGLYDPYDILAAVEARTPNLISKRIMRCIAGGAGGNGSLVALAARAYRGPAVTALLPTEVQALVAPYVAARACGADATDDDRTHLPAAARLLGVDPETAFGVPALCAEIAHALGPTPKPG